MKLYNFFLSCKISLYACKIKIDFAHSYSMNHTIIIQTIGYYIIYICICIDYVYLDKFKMSKMKFHPSLIRAEIEFYFSSRENYPHSTWLAEYPHIQRYEHIQPSKIANNFNWYIFWYWQLGFRQLGFSTLSAITSSALFYLTDQLSHYQFYDYIDQDAYNCLMSYYRRLF